MVDFSKLVRLAKERTIVLYRCDACGEEEEYVTPMPEGWRHGLTRSFRKCEGLLVEVSRRTEPRP